MRAGARFQERAKATFTDPAVWIASILAILLIIALSPYLEQRHWPFETQLPGIWVALVIGVMFLLFMVGSQGNRRSVEHQAEPQSAWRHVNQFRLRQAACLFAGIDPEIDEEAVDRSGQAKIWFERLNQAWNANELERISRQNPNIRFTNRQSLRSFAEKWGVKREFLS
jgi:hypothetical protein